jgi:peptide-methionine (S)-S-oxide reductase
MTHSVSVYEAVPGRAVPLDVPETHAVFPDRRIKPPFPDDLRTAVFALGWTRRGFRTRRC